MLTVNDEFTSSEPTLHQLFKDRVHIKDREMDFPDGPLAKTLRANAGDTGSIPGPRRFHMAPDI